jgi:hypothetical protein
MICWKLCDLLRLYHGRALQFSETFAGQFDQVPTRWWWVLKIVVDRIDGAQVGHDRLRGIRQCAHAWSACVILHLHGEVFE